MTIKHRYLVEPSDVLVITFTCRCKASLTLLIGKPAQLPNTCPSCNEGWFPIGSNDRKILTDLFHGLAELRERGKDVLCQIHLEILPPNGQP